MDSNVGKCYQGIGLGKFYDLGEARQKFKETQLLQVGLLLLLLFLQRTDVTSAVEVFRDD